MQRITKPPYFKFVHTLFVTTIRHQTQANKNTQENITNTNLTQKKGWLKVGFWRSNHFT